MSHYEQRAFSLTYYCCDKNRRIKFIINKGHFKIQTVSKQVRLALIFQSMAKEKGLENVLHVVCHHLAEILKIPIYIFIP